jgi:integrase
MARVKIENARVVKIMEGYGFRAEEVIRLRNGDDAKRYYTVWTKTQVQENDVVSIAGELSVKVEEYTGRDNVPKVGAAVHINEAVIQAAIDAPF